MIGAAMIASGLAAVAFAQYRTRVWSRYESEMQDPVDDPPDALVKHDFTVGRVRYRSPLDRGRFYSRWGIDANKGDRLFLGLLRRLTRIDAQSIESIIDLSNDEIFNLPWLVAISVGDWKIEPSEAHRLRDYFDRGGFLMVDDFHNDREWAIFMDGIHQIYPDAHVIEIENDHPAFHSVYDLEERIRVPGANVIYSGGIERGGMVPHWRAIVDSKDRMIVAISFNQDIGDGWEFADEPAYPEKFSSQAIRLGINYAMYAMTH